MLSSVPDQFTPCSGYDDAIFDRHEIDLLDVICPVCLCVARDCVQTPCGHLFCNGCILRHLMNKSDCPVDHRPIAQMDIIVDARTRRMVLNLKVKCPNGGPQLDSPVCEWSGPLREYDKHLATTCGFRNISCPYEKVGCNVELRVHEMDEHLKDALHHLLLMEAAHDKLKKAYSTLKAAKDRTEDMLTQALNQLPTPNLRPFPTTHSTRVNTFGTPTTTYGSSNASPFGSHSGFAFESANSRPLSRPMSRPVPRPYSPTYLVPISRTGVALTLEGVTRMEYLEGQYGFSDYGSSLTTQTTSSPASLRFAPSVVPSASSAASSSSQFVENASGNYSNVPIGFDFSQRTESARQENEDAPNAFTFGFECKR